MGTDNLGRDVFTRVLFGARVALEVSIAAVGLSLSLGVVLGGIAGFGGAWLDRCMILVFDAVCSFPTILFAMALVMLAGPSLLTIIAVVVVTSTPVYARIVRTQTLALRSQEFVTAERSLGAGTVRILYHHILPNLIGPLLILASMDIPVVISIESGLSGLGLGVRPPTPSWGSIRGGRHPARRAGPRHAHSHRVARVARTGGGCDAPMRSTVTCCDMARSGFPG